MGVTDLWKILAPAQRHVPLEELRGQTLAVDLSIWVVEAEGVMQMKGRVVRPYLRYANAPYTCICRLQFSP